MRTVFGVDTWVVGEALLLFRAETAHGWVDWGEQFLLAKSCLACHEAVN
jgi:hypothetical protein